VNGLAALAVSSRQFGIPQGDLLMKKILTVVVAALCVCAPWPLSATSVTSTEARVTAGAVKVTVNYKGKAKVDATHKLWVWIFDTPNIGPSSQPLDQIALDKNGAVAEFANVVQGQVYIAVAFDEQGVMTGNEPPPPGSPIAIHSGANGAPAPITPGDKGLVTITFDETLRMQ